MKGTLQSVLAMVVLGATSIASAAVVDLSATATGPGLNIGDTGLIPTTTVAPGLFTKDWFFSLNSPSGLGGDVVSVNIGALTHIHDPDLTLIDTTTSTTYATDVKTFSLASLPSGNYELEVTGKATGSAGGIYSGAVTVSAVPLPAAAWLLLSGLVGVGLMARRRSVDDIA
jgi:hypothetical protein